MRLFTYVPKEWLREGGIRGGGLYGTAANDNQIFTRAALLDKLACRMSKQTCTRIEQLEFSKLIRR